MQNFLALLWEGAVKVSLLKTHIALWVFIGIVLTDQLSWQCQKFCWRSLVLHHRLGSCVKGILRHFFERPKFSAGIYFYHIMNIIMRHKVEVRRAAAPTHLTWLLQPGELWNPLCCIARSALYFLRRKFANGKMSASSEQGWCGDGIPLPLLRKQ